MLREFFCWLKKVIIILYIKNILKYYGNLCFFYVYLEKVIVFNIFCLDVVILNCMEVVVVV